MEHASPRTRRRARTHSRILEVCRRRIGTHGLDGLRLTEIADAVDLTAAALYRYFRSKGALIAALNAQIVLEQQSALHRIERGATRDGLPDPLLATMAFIEHLTRTIEREPGDFGLVCMTLADPRVLVEDPADAIHIPAVFAWLASIQDVLGRAGEAGSMVLPVPEEAAHRLVFSTLGVMQLGKLSRFDTALRPGRVARSVAWDLLVAWGVSQHALESRKVAARTLSEEILS